MGFDTEKRWEREEKLAQEELEGDEKRRETAEEALKALSEIQTVEDISKSPLERAVNLLNTPNASIDMRNALGDIQGAIASLENGEVDVAWAKVEEARGSLKDEIVGSPSPNERIYGE